MFSSTVYPSIMLIKKRRRLFLITCTAHDSGKAAEKTRMVGNTFGVKLGFSLGHSTYADQTPILCVSVTSPGLNPKGDGVKSGAL